MGTNTGTVMTIANSIIGVSVLAMPFCFKQCGIVLSIVMLILSSILTRLTCYLLLKSAIMSRRRNFEFLAFHIFGTTGKFLTELCIIGYLMGTCIAFFVIVGDLGPEIISESLAITNGPALRPGFMIGLALLVILPLGLLRNIDSLSSVCIATIGFYVCLVIKVFFEALPHLLSGIWLEKVHYWRPAGVLQCLPIFSGALFCQMTLFEIYDSLPNPSLERMSAAVHAAINMCTGFYIAVGFLGYVAFCTQPFGGNILMSFLPSVMSDLIKFGFVLSLAVSFPLVIFPCRASLYSLLYKRIQAPHHETASSFIPETRFKCLTCVIIAAALAVGLVVPSIEIVLGLVGSTIGVGICVMFPALAFICVSAKATADRVTAQLLLFVGVLILVLGTYATLNAQPEPAKSALPPPLMPAAAADVHFQLPAAAAAAVAAVARAEDAAGALAAVQKDGDGAEVVARREPPVPQESAPAPKRDDAESREKAEVIHSDALRKEDEELADAEKRDIGESHQKNVEVLRKIERNKEEQEKLLQEQKKIILNFQKERAKDEESALKRKDLKVENEVVKVEKVVQGESVEKRDGGLKAAAPDAPLEMDVKGQRSKESVIVQEAGDLRSENDGVIVKPASSDLGIIGNSGNLKDVEPGEKKIEPVPQSFPYQDQLVKNVAESPIQEKSNKIKVLPLRNMTIKSIIMPKFGNKIPVARAGQNSDNIPEAKKTDDEQNKSKERELQLEVDKIISADILKKNVVPRIDEAKSNQRDILSADSEKREREKRDANLTGDIVETNKLSILQEVKEQEEGIIEEEAKDCPKVDGVIQQDVNQSDKSAEKLKKVADFVGASLSEEPLIVVGARLTDPRIAADNVVVVGELVSKTEELAEGAKPMTRDLKSIVAASKNITLTPDQGDDLNEKIKI